MPENIESAFEEWFKEWSMQTNRLDITSVSKQAFLAGWKAAQHSVQRTVDRPCEKHNMEFCSECFPVVVVDFNRR